MAHSRPQSGIRYATGAEDLMKKLKLNAETLRVLTAPAASPFQPTYGPTSEVEFTCTCTVPFTG